MAHTLTHRDRAALFELLVGAPNLPPGDDFERFRLLCFHGIPDSGSLRPRAWRLLLGVLPFTARSDWQKLLYEQRKSYYAFLNDLIPVFPPLKLKQTTNPAVGMIQTDDVSNDGTSPLSPLSNQDADDIEDMDCLDQIDMDVRRTLPDIAFFQLPVPWSRHSPLHSPRSPKETTEIPHFPTVCNRRALFKHLELIRNEGDFGARKRGTSDIVDVAGIASATTSTQDSTIDTPDLHWEAVERILFLYAKLNPGIGYVQGMNELLAPIYYVLANDPDEESSAHAEADAFYLFTALMSEFRDHFIRSLDNMSRRSSRISLRSSESLEHIPTVTGTDTSTPKRMAFTSGANHRISGNTRRINGTDPSAVAGDDVQRTGIGETMSRLMRRLHQIDPELHRDIKHKRIDPIFFAFRWISVLFTQEFPLPDVIRIWDALLADVAVDITEYKADAAGGGVAGSNRLPGHNRAVSPSGNAAAQGIGTPLQNFATGGATDAFSITGPLPPPIRSRQNKFEFTIDFACAMITSIRDRILSSSFSDSLKLLQSYPVQDVEVILARAWEYHTAVSNATTSDARKKQDQMHQMDQKRGQQSQPVAALTSLFKRTPFVGGTRSVSMPSGAGGGDVLLLATENDAKELNGTSATLPSAKPFTMFSGSTFTSPSNQAATGKASLFYGLGIKSTPTVTSEPAQVAEPKASTTLPSQSAARRPLFGNLNLFNRALTPTEIPDHKNFSGMLSEDFLNGTDVKESDAADTGTPVSAVGAARSLGMPESASTVTSNAKSSPLNTMSGLKLQASSSQPSQQQPTFAGFAKFIRTTTMKLSASSNASPASAPHLVASVLPVPTPPDAQGNTIASAKRNALPQAVPELVWQRPLSNDDVSG